jgi:hypothetical protein
MHATDSNHCVYYIGYILSVWQAECNTRLLHLHQHLQTTRIIRNDAINVIF